MTRVDRRDDHADEDALEPLHLIRLSDVVLRAGIQMLGAGTSGLRVREVMEAVARTVGIERINAQITFTDIVLTVQRRGIFRTQVAEISAPGVNAHRIALVKEFAEKLPERAGVAEVDALLDTIDRTPRLYPTWLLALDTSTPCTALALGRVGDGHRMKLLNNFLSLGYAAIYAEALALAAKVGISTATFDSVIRGGRMDCGFYQTFMACALEGNREAHRFTLSNAYKDLRYLESCLLYTSPSPRD